MALPFADVGIRRSVRRKARSVSVEPSRSGDDDVDAFEWYCFECNALVHRAEVKIKSLVTDLPPIYQAFYEDEKARTCPNCGALHPGKKPPAGWVKL